MATTDIGRVTPIWRGFYSAATAYELNDLVIDNSGSVWWHKSEELTTGVVPAAGEIWDAVIDMSIFSGLIQAAITTAQTALAAAQAALADVAADMERAETAADNAENSAAAASESAAGVGALAQAAERSAEAAAGSATGAAGSAQAAAGSKSDAEAYAVGKRGGEDVGSTDPTYHNNAKYYAEQAASEAEAAAQSAEDAQDVLDSIPADYSQLSADVGDLKTQTDQLIELPTENLVDIADFTVTGNTTTALDTENNAITVTTASAGTYRCAQTENTFIPMNLIAGRSYRMHAKAEVISGNPAVYVAIRGVDGNPDQIACSLKLEDGKSGFMNFTADEYMKRVSLFVTMAASASASVKFTELWLKEYDVDSTVIDEAVFTRTETEDRPVSNKTANASSTGTTNIALGATISSGGSYTVEIDSTTTKKSTQSVKWRNDSGNLNTIGTIPANANHVVFQSTAPNANANRIRIDSGLTTGTYTVNIYRTVKTVTNNIAKNATDLSALSTSLSALSASVDDRFYAIGKKEPIANLMTFRRGYWSGSEFKTNVLYRVGCPTEMTFDKTFQLVALNGFAMSGYRNGVSFSTAGTLWVNANEPIRLYIRRVWEDESETADVDEFTTGIYALNYNPSSEYALKYDTFAGIEMFRTAGFIGDSYTATRLGYSWVDIVQNITGVTCTKYAKSGADCHTWINSATYGLPALLSETPKDLYWLALGINDGDLVDTNSSYLGSISDISGDDYTLYPNTFYGNMGHIIEAIQAYAPKAKIVLYKPIFTSIKRTLAGQAATKNGIKQVRDAIGEIAEHYNLPVMDALNDVLFQSAIYDASMDSAVSNGTHPSVMLYPAIAKANLRLFAKAVLEKRSYFLDIRYDT